MIFQTVVIKLYRTLVWSRDWGLLLRYVSHHYSSIFKSKTFWIKLPRNKIILIFSTSLTVLCCSWYLLVFSLTILITIDKFTNHYCLWRNCDISHWPCYWDMHVETQIFKFLKYWSEFLLKCIKHIHKWNEFKPLYK